VDITIRDVIIVSGGSFLPAALRLYSVLTLRGFTLAATCAPAKNAVCHAPSTLRVSMPLPHSSRHVNNTIQPTKNRGRDRVLRLHATPPQRGRYWLVGRAP
jgi:hypothetical protein